MNRPAIFTWRFWGDVTDRIVRSSAQTAAALIAADSSFVDLDWGQIGGVVGLAALATLLTSLAASGLGAPGTAGLVADASGKALADLRSELAELRDQIAAHGPPTTYRPTAT